MSVQAPPARLGTKRGWQLAIGVLCMALIANLQYGWTLFVSPIEKAHGWRTDEIQLAFSIFVAIETWLTPVEGFIVDRLGERGPRLMVASGAVLVALGWGLNSIANSLFLLYAAAALSGIGAGGIYATCIGNAVKWFPDRRGLAVGLTAAGFGAGAALTVVPIRMLIASHGYEATFLIFAIAQGVVVFALAFALRPPRPGEVAPVSSPKLQQTTRNFTPSEVLASPIFWLLYVMFVAISASGLTATAQIALIAKSYGVADIPIWLGLSTLTAALLVDNVMNGLARPFFGWVSDIIGREYTMAIAFSIGGAAYWLLDLYGTSPLAFVVFAGLIFFTWGEIFSLFPSTATDSFGAKFATTNTSLLYTAKGMSAFLVPLANLLQGATGSWHAVFLAATLTNFAVALLALLVLRPMRIARVGALPALTKA
ncbi:MAG: oxalate/formate MFS antiporter [Hyphomicrobiales bacterium]|nr:oxalate/formate MFS antiporter [Hyphomicrobiales bacterium]MBV9430797.1 oxalate/formate MFS antiporter [Hyphomicrobiales bacterium]